MGWGRVLNRILQQGLGQTINSYVLYNSSYCKASVKYVCTNDIATLSAMLPRQRLPTPTLPRQRPPNPPRSPTSYIQTAGSVGAHAQTQRL